MNYYQVGKEHAESHKRRNYSVIYAETHTDFVDALDSYDQGYADGLGLPAGQEDLEWKINALRYCLMNESTREYPNEDAMVHIFDLIHYLAPGYKFGEFNTLQEIAEHYGDNPITIVGNFR